MAEGITHPLSRRLLGGRSLLLAACLCGGTLGAAKAEDAYICKLYARESLRTIYIHNLKTPDAQSVDQQQKALPETTDTTKLPFFYQKLIATCLASAKVPDLPDVPEATDKIWLQDLISSHLSKATGSPAAAAAAVKPAVEASAGEAPAGGAPEQPGSIQASQQAKAEATCGRVNMKVAWSNNGRSWRCVK